MLFMVVRMMLLLGYTGLVFASPELTEGEARFFHDCPDGRSLRLHRDTHPWDLHALFYTTMSLTEVELLRIIDWTINVPWPGPSVTPTHRLVDGIRRQYDRLPQIGLVRRTGEFVDALQIPELSLGDVSATYSVATEGQAGLGSGMLIRVYKLVDWTQHIVGDTNRLLGKCVGYRQGLITWKLPERSVDALQWLSLKTFNTVSVLITRTLDKGLSLVERTLEAPLNLGYQRAHWQTSVFLRLPHAVYERHKRWMYRHRAKIALGTQDLFLSSTHAALSHSRRKAASQNFLDEGAKEIIVMLPIHLFSRAPKTLRPYVVPASWVLSLKPHQDTPPYGWGERVRECGFARGIGKAKSAASWPKANWPEFRLDGEIPCMEEPRASPVGTLSVDNIDGDV